ncbi:hypothetical protein GOODEAATRI_023397 [Goodea atripinnis]|uniref:Uncharacterized protein n=1 Tax=Goodea atripinnis TaxID=208336 RepID=A0ABV0NPA1_9TELE
MSLVPGPTEGSLIDPQDTRTHPPPRSLFSVAGPCYHRQVTRPNTYPVPRAFHTVFFNPQWEPLAAWRSSPRTQPLSFTRVFLISLFLLVYVCPAHSSFT